MSSSQTGDLLQVIRGFPCISLRSSARSHGSPGLKHARLILIGGSHKYVGKHPVCFGVVFTCLFVCLLACLLVCLFFWWGGVPRQTYASLISCPLGLASNLSPKSSPKLTPRPLGVDGVPHPEPGYLALHVSEIHMATNLLKICFVFSDSTVWFPILFTHPCVHKPHGSLRFFAFSGKRCLNGMGSCA